MKILKWLVHAGVGASLFFAGVGAHMALTRKGIPSAPPPAAEVFAKTPTPKIRIPGSVPRTAAPAKAGPTPPRSQGPFSYAFTPNERLTYRVATHIEGWGYDAAMPSDISLDFSSDMSVLTESVDRQGNGTLRVMFDRTAMEGHFMDVPFALNMTSGDTFMAHSDRTLVDTRQGVGAAEGVPQLEFFQQPIIATISPTGQVLSVSGVEGFSGLLGAAQPATHIEFPHAHLQPGERWVSHIALPIPGFGAAAEAQVVNTLNGFMYLGDRYCGVIVQELVSEQHDGALDVPQSVFGEPVQFKLPAFDLQGMNVLYFDVDNGHLVFAELGLQLGMRIAQVQGGASGVAGELAALLSETLGKSLGDTNALLDELVGPQSKQDSLLDFTVAIDGAVTLVDWVPPSQQTEVFKDRGLR